MGFLVLTLTGPPEISFQNVPLKFRSRKVLALLIFLAVEGGVHSRDKIAGMLWPESDQDHARASFRNTLLRLRKSLAPAGEYLFFDAETIGFDVSQPHQLKLDAPGEFLEGFSLPDAPDFDHWVLLQREAHRRRFEEQFDQRSRIQLDNRQFNDAIESATQWLALDPFNESAAARLMQAHFMAGNRTAAMAVYSTLERTLAEELNVTPSPETARLAESIRAAAPSTFQEVRPQLSNLPFVGRAIEHGQLAAAYQKARQGSTQGVCVEGEAGMGKTRLVETFFDWVALQGPVDILRGRAFEVGGRLPYQPLVDALRVRLDAENAPDDLLSDIWLAELSQLLPELRDRYPDLPRALSGNPEFTRSRLFEAVATLGQALAARKPGSFPCRKAFAN
jgi:DNA-binding SARP family transcriptional activator